MEVFDSPEADVLLDVVEDEGDREASEEEAQAVHEVADVGDANEELPRVEGEGLGKERLGVVDVLDDFHKDDIVDLAWADRFAQRLARFDDMAREAALAEDVDAARRDIEPEELAVRFGFLEVEEEGPIAAANVDDRAAIGDVRGDEARAVQVSGCRGVLGAPFPILVVIGEIVERHRAAEEFPEILEAHRQGGGMLPSADRIASLFAPWRVGKLLNVFESRGRVPTDQRRTLMLRREIIDELL